MRNWSKMTPDEVFNSFYRTSEMNRETREQRDSSSSNRYFRNGNGYYDPTASLAIRATDNMSNSTR